MMTDPAFAIKNEVQCLIEIQIDTLRKQSSLSSLKLDEYHSRSEKIAALYRELNAIPRERFSSLGVKVS